MNHHPLARPLLELLAPYGDFNSICLAAKSGLLDDERWFWHIYAEERPAIHFWKKPEGGLSFVAIRASGAVETQAQHRSRRYHRNLQEAIKDVFQ